jgi:hypothetical protein
MTRRSDAPAFVGQPPDLPGNLDLSGKAAVSIHGVPYGPVCTVCLKMFNATKKPAWRACISSNTLAMSRPVARRQRRDLRALLPLHTLLLLGQRPSQLLQQALLGEIRRLRRRLDVQRGV